MGGAIQIVAFVLSAFIAIAGALGMATTMSMFRSAILLMASFMGVAGLFLLLSADLLGLLQIMMYIGGMLVMALFMVLFMPDPGGAMMADMPDMMTPVERLFSLGLVAKTPTHAASEDHGEEGRHAHHHEGGHQGAAHDRAHVAHGDNNQGGHGDMSEISDMSDMSDMSMVTPVRAWAAWLAVAMGCGLVGLLVLRPSWSVSSAAPDPNSARQVGSLLMGKYMVGFEGAGVLILIGIFGAVLAAHSHQHPDKADRSARVAVNKPPPAVEPDLLKPLSEPRPNHDHDSSRPGDPNSHVAAADGGKLT
jgi:NADH-quinone oxidoreductase subunit J